MFCQFEYNKPTFVDNNLLGPPLYLAIFVVNVSPFIYVHNEKKNEELYEEEKILNYFVCKPP